MSSRQPDAAQIRGALGLLRWENQDLAKACGVTAQSISNIKNGATRPQPRVLSAIRHVLEFHDIEFLENSGVRFKPEAVEVLDGKEGVEQFWNRVFTFAQITGGIIRQNGIPEGPLDQCAPEAAANHRERMLPLVHKRKDIFVRAILEEGDTYFLCDNYVDYRWNPKEFPPPVPYYVFGDSVAIFAFESDPSPKIILITSPVVAEAYSKQFDRVWELGKAPPKAKKMKAAA